MSETETNPNRRHPRKPARRLAWLAPVMTASLLGGMLMYGFTLPVPADANPYHAQIKTIARAITEDPPPELAGWVGKDQEVPREAQVLLRPNLIISRHFVNGRTGEQANLLVVQCKDARDIAGHWPPNCYPAQGLVLEHSEPRTWTVGGTVYEGREYWFADPFRPGQERVVSNFLIIPDGRAVADMKAVRDATGDYELRYFGAAQVQVLTEEELTDERRREIVELFIAGYRPLIEAMKTGRDALKTS